MLRIVLVAIALVSLTGCFKPIQERADILCKGPAKLVEGMVVANKYSCPDGSTRILTY